MKKLLLMVTASLAIAPAFAQSAKSVVLLKDRALKGIEAQEKASLIKNLLPSGNKGTANPDTTWFSYTNIATNDDSKLYYNVIYQDSNVVYQGSSGPVHVNMHGMGHVFDPTDSVYFAGSPSVPYALDRDFQPHYRVTAGNSYIVDSVRFLSKYMRKTGNDDTMFVQYVSVNKSTANPRGLFTLQYSNAYDIAADGTPSFATAYYDSVTNLLMTDSIKKTVYTDTIVLDQTFFNDTNANGFSMRTMNGIALKNPLTMSAGQVMLIYVTVKSPVNYPNNTDASTANTFRMYTYDIEGLDESPRQTVNTLESGLVATRQSKYSPPYDGFMWEGHDVLIPDIAYSTAGLFTHFDFHVKCATCPELSVKNLNTTSISANAYPNPANAEVKIPFAVGTQADVNVTMTNTIGQVVKAQSFKATAKGTATFNTSDLAAGVYMYTVEANGQRQTGRVVVSH